MPSVLKVNELQNTSGDSALTIDDDGRISMPQKPAFFMQGTSASNKTIAYHEVFGATDDGQAAFSTTAEGSFLQQFSYDSATGEITPLVDGVYFLGGCFYHNQTSDCRVRIDINGERRAMAHHNSSVVKTMHVSCVLSLTTTDKITFVNDAGSDRVFYEGADHTYVFGHLVG